MAAAVYPVVEKPNPKHQKELGEPAFSPDGRYIYFSLDSTPGGTFIYAQDSNKQVYEIRRHDLEMGHTESFVTGPGGAVRPTPSPDGKYLAFVRRIRMQSALFLKDLESGVRVPDLRRPRPRHAGSLGRAGPVPEHGLDAGLEEHRLLGGWRHQAHQYRQS